MTKRIKHLPEWFNAKNYEGVDDLTPEQLIKQLRYRRICRQFVRTGEYYINGKFRRNPSARLWEIENTRKYGLVLDQYNPTNNDDVIQRHYPTHGSDRFTAVRPLTCMMLQSAAGAISEAGSADETFDVTFIRGITPWDITCREITIEETNLSRFSNRNFAHLGIDLSQSDTEILKQMKEFLPEYRERLSVLEAPKKRKSFPAMRDVIVRDRVIQFLDILIWEEQNDLQIDRDTLARELYPDGRASADMLYKPTGTIYKNAEKMIDDEFFATYDPAPKLTL